MLQQQHRTNPDSGLLILASADCLFPGSRNNCTGSILDWIFPLKLLWCELCTLRGTTKTSLCLYPLERQATFHSFNQTWWMLGTHHVMVFIVHTFLAWNITFTQIKLSPALRCEDLLLICTLYHFKVLTVAQIKPAAWRHCWHYCCVPRYNALGFCVQN